MGLAVQGAFLRKIYNICNQLWICIYLIIGIHFNRNCVLNTVLNFISPFLLHFTQRFFNQHFFADLIKLNGILCCADDDDWRVWKRYYAINSHQNDLHITNAIACTMNIVYFVAFQYVQHDKHWSSFWICRRSNFTLNAVRPTKKIHSFRLTFFSFSLCRKREEKECSAQLQF